MDGVDTLMLLYRYIGRIDREMGKIGMNIWIKLRGGILRVLGVERYGESSWG